MVGTQVFYVFPKCLKLSDFFPFSNQFKTYNGTSTSIDPTPGHPLPGSPSRGSAPTTDACPARRRPPTSPESPRRGSPGEEDSDAGRGMLGGRAACILKSGKYRI